jgi:arylsulfatase A-like enzyme
LNLIFIMMDGARSDKIPLGKNYGDLIKKSAFFPKTITYAPYTIAALHAVFSGTYGHRNGVDSYWSSPKFKKNDFKSLALYLKDANYFTYADVINNLVIPKVGFDEFVVHDEMHDDLTERHKTLIKKMTKLKQEKKNFFLYLHYSNIHTGIMEHVLKKYTNFSQEYFDNKQKNEIFYDTLFSNADNYLGSIIDYCEKLNLLEDTLIVVISDHGVSIGEKFGERAYGVFCYDYTLISTACFYKKNLSKIEYKNQVRSIDILPTILEMLDIPLDSKYKKIDGKTLTPLINGKKEERIAFSQSGNPLKNNEPPKKPNISSIRTDNWKYIFNEYDDTEELYDLILDEKETDNLFSSKPKIIINLKNYMNKILNDV